MNEPRYDVLSRIQEAAMEDGLTVQSKLLAEGRIKVWAYIPAKKVYVRPAPRRRRESYEIPECMKKWEEELS